MSIETTWLLNHYKKFWLFLLKVLVKTKPMWFFCPHVQLDQRAIFGQVDLKTTILTGSFLLVFFITFFTRFYLLNHHDNNIIWAITINIYNLNCFYL
jgi:hypothetical protein